MSEESKLPRLTLKQKRFIKEYLKDLNASQACRRAGYDVSDENADKLGSQLLGNTRLIPHLNKALDEHEYRIEVDTEDIVEEILNIGMGANIADFIEISGKRALLVKDFNTLTDDQKRCISSMKETEWGIEVKLHDKLKALQMLGKWKKMFVDKIQVETNETIEINIDGQDANL